MIKLLNIPKVDPKTYWHPTTIWLPRIFTGPSGSQYKVYLESVSRRRNDDMQKDGMKFCWQYRVFFDGEPLFHYEWVPNIEDNCW